MKFKNYVVYISAIVGFLILTALMFTIARDFGLSNNPDNPKNPNDNIPINEGITVVPTLLDKIDADSTWVPTFQLIWNDLKSEIVKGDVIFNPQLDVVANLNKETFTENNISNEYYYKVIDFKTLELKKKIEDEISKRFNQKSDILDMFDWSESELHDPNDPTSRRYFLYTMLYREFEYEYEFKKLENSKFKSYNDIEYFGINSSSDYKVVDQIKVLFYKDDSNFAISLKTKSNDEVIFYKNPTGTTFDEILTNFNKEVQGYTDIQYLRDIDTFKAPILKINQLKEYSELEGKVFKTNDPIYDTAEIAKAIQTVKFEINEKGGKIKSEAGMDIKNEATALPSEPETPRHYELDNTFVIMLREEGKDIPYFISRIDDIRKYQ